MLYSYLQEMLLILLPLCTWLTSTGGIGSSVFHGDVSLHSVVVVVITIDWANILIWQICCRTLNGSQFVNQYWVNKHIHIKCFYDFTTVQFIVYQHETFIWNVIWFLPCLIKIFCVTRQMFKHRRQAQVTDPKRYRQLEW